MTDDKFTFPILTKDVPLIGRDEIMNKVWSNLTKQSPDNLSIVGPRYVGKTVLLQALRQRAEQDDSFDLVVYWELSYDTPQSNKEFAEKLCQQVSSAMRRASSGDYNEYLKELDKYQNLQTLKEVMDFMEEEHKSALVIWDGFDKALDQGKLSAQLFGELRSLFYGKKHYLVTATRATNTELARSPEIQDSPLWNILNQVTMSIFNENDLNSMYDKSGLKINKGAKTEIENWTGGAPVLVAKLLNQLMLNSNNQECDEAFVNTTAKQIEDHSEIARMVKDCNEEGLDTFRSLLDKPKQDINGFNRPSIQFLINRGLVLDIKGKVQPSCRFFGEYMDGSGQGQGTVSRLFADWESYRWQIRSVLELRLGQIPVVNNRLHKLVKRGLEDIPEEPNDCLTNLSAIEDSALEQIWKHELPDRKIPQNIIENWTLEGRDSDNLVREIINSDAWTIPSERYKQLELLKLLTGSKARFESTARNISKDTYVLLHAIHQFRNRSEHSDGQKIHEGVAVSALLLCIELLDCLARELG